MRTTHHPIHHVLALVGMGLLLAGLCGSPILPAASTAAWNHSRISRGGVQSPLGISLRGAGTGSGAEHPGGYRHDQLALRSWGTACPIATRFIRRPDVSCGVSASGVAGRIRAVNTGANRQDGGERMWAPSSWRC